jgi:hypothetical protein
MYMVLVSRFLVWTSIRATFLEEPNLAMKNARLMYKMKEGAKS